MKRKEKKQLAEKIAKYERIIQSTNDKDKIKEAESKIMELSTHVCDLEDMVEIDEMVQDLLAD
jgi:short-subunit dehydrogenase involved in D-alanine esterification of teichoic acids